MTIFCGTNLYSDYWIWSKIFEINKIYNQLLNINNSINYSYIYLNYAFSLILLNFIFY